METCNEWDLAANSGPYPTAEVEKPNPRQLSYRDEMESPIETDSNHCLWCGSKLEEETEVDTKYLILAARRLLPVVGQFTALQLQIITEYYRLPTSLRSHRRPTTGPTEIAKRLGCNRPYVDRVLARWKRQIAKQ